MKNFPVAYFNSNNGKGTIAFGEGEVFIKKTIKKTDFQKLDSFISKNKGKFIVGSISYDIKNSIEQLESNNSDFIQFPDLFFWIPKYVVEFNNENFNFIQGEKNDESFDFLNHILEEETDNNFHQYPFDFKERISKNVYIQQVNSLKNHIQQGNIYEVNFCQEYYAENVELNFPLDAYFKLNQITQAPFSCYLNIDSHIVLCGSPERFIQKTDNKIISQPIKGTSKRGETTEQDELLKKELQSNQKERSENIMIVDLVRNDLSKIAKKGSVHVDELCGIYSFKTVHQMISTVSCNLNEDVNFSEILKATFPMGSMTGAPKVSAMKLIEQHESFKRGLFSGSIGYIKPNGDFDFNVIIRSLLYNKENKYLSCSVGSAITIKSDAELEYEECQVKIKRILDGMKHE